VQPRRLLFGDRIVAQSHWTRAQFQQAFRDEGRPVPEIEVIFPPTPRVQRRDSEHVQGELARLGLTSRGPLFVYPGDLEVGGGAETTLEIARSLADALPKAQVVLAYRKKTRRADEIASDLQRRADPERVKIVPDVPDILALLQGAAAVLFPVDDLYGKVDLPIVLLEALALGTPVLCLDQGPLRDLEGALRLPSAVSAWVSPLVELAGQGDLEGRLRAAGPRATSAHFSAERAAARYDALYRSLW
jgi:phosphatidylinositol alpha-1,6-mannosyltransferase